MASAATVVIAESDALAREIVTRACAARAVSVLAETSSATDLPRLCSKPAPDVALVGDCADGMPPDAAIEEVLGSGTRVVVLSADPSPERLTAVLGLGVQGYLFYDTSPDDVANAVLTVAAGSVAIDPKAAGVILGQWRRLRSQTIPIGSRPGRLLTEREQDVLAAMAEGLATKAIANRLGVALKTVENHKIRVFEKLRVRNHAQAVSVAISYGLVAQNGSADLVSPRTNADVHPI
jgi:DNA-binding NarL/FixJ family response regulator